MAPATMSSRPIFVATHPRACSTAFERVFLTRRDILQCAHEPFGDAFYYGPERLSQRFEQDEAARTQSGFANSTYKTIMDRLENDAAEGKRVFIKDMAYYFFPPDGKPAKLAPSLLEGLTNGYTNGNGQTNGHTNGHTNGVVEKDNPTVVPTELLRKFHFTFLIRHPRRAIPSYFRCTVPPLDDVTGFHHFMPNEAGYEELVRLFEYLREEKIVGPALADDADADKGNQTPITLIDADDLLDNPEGIIKAFCEQVGIEFTPDMLSWDDKENQEYVSKAFEKWRGFHNDAIESTELKPRAPGHKKTPSNEDEDAEWSKKFGEDAAKVIRKTVNDNIPHYEYLKQFIMKAK